MRITIIHPFTFPDMENAEKKILPSQWFYIGWRSFSNIREIICLFPRFVRTSITYIHPTYCNKSNKIKPIKKCSTKRVKNQELKGWFL